MYKILGADKNEYGPVSAQEVQQWIAQRRLNAQSLARLEGTEEWRPLGQFPEFSAALSTTSPPPAPASTSIPPLSGSPLPLPPNRMAITGLVMGCLALVCCQFVAIPGIICSAMALSEIKRNPSQPGRGMAVAGLVLSILSLIFLGLLVAFGAFSSVFQQMSR